MVLGHDVVADLLQLGEVDVVAAEHLLRRLGVAEDRGERLVQLMRDRRGELPTVDTRVMWRSAVRSSSALSSVGLRSVTSIATPTVFLGGLPFSARPCASIHRTPPSGRHSVLDVDLVARRQRVVDCALESLAVRRMRGFEHLAESGRWAARSDGVGGRRAGRRRRAYPSATS